MDNTHLQEDYNIDPIYNWLMSHQVATISIIKKVHQNETCEIETPKRDLTATLLRKGYGYVKIGGFELNNQENESNIILVVNINDDPQFLNTITKLGEYLNLDFELLQSNDLDIPVIRNLITPIKLISFKNHSIGAKMAIILISNPIIKILNI